MGENVSERCGVWVRIIRTGMVYGVKMSKRCVVYG